MIGIDRDRAGNDALIAEFQAEGLSGEMYTASIGDAKGIAQIARDVHDNTRRSTCWSTMLHRPTGEALMKHPKRV